MRISVRPGAKIRRSLGFSRAVGSAPDATTSVTGLYRKQTWILILHNMCMCYNILPYYMNSGYSDTPMHIILCNLVYNNLIPISVPLQRTIYYRCIQFSMIISCGGGMDNYRDQIVTMLHSVMWVCLCKSAPTVHVVQ